MISNQPTIFHAVIEEPITQDPLDETANFFIESENQIIPLAKKVRLIASVVQTLYSLDLKKNKLWVIGRTRDEMTRYGITVKSNPEFPKQAIINVIKYKSLTTLQLHNAPKYREFLILVLSKEFTEEQFLSTDLDLRSLSTFSSQENHDNFIDSYIRFEKDIRGARIF